MVDSIAAAGCGRQVDETEVEPIVVVDVVAIRSLVAVVGDGVALLHWYYMLFAQEVVQRCMHGVEDVVDGVLRVEHVLAAAVVTAVEVVAKALIGRLHSNLADLEVDNSR